MKFIIESVSTYSGRLGLITNIERLPNIKYQTPMLMLNTKGGSVPYLSKEVLELVTNKEPQCIELNIGSTESMEKSVKEFGKGISKFVGLSDCLTFLALKDPSESSPSGFHEKEGIPVFTRSGKLTITSKRFMDIVEVYRPDFYHVLCDGDTNSTSSKKRVLKCIERTETFFNDCLERHKTSNCLKNSLLIASLEGGYDIIAREKLIKAIDKHDEISGYFIDGLHTNGFDASKSDEALVKSIVDHSLKLIKSDKLRIMAGAYNPLTVLELIKLGIDLFDSSYPSIISSQYIALIFNFNIANPIPNGYFYNLSEAKFKEDFSPILENCQCLTCQKHTKAYINHLINTKELLAPILLMIHNTHHYLEYFKVIRETIKTDKLPELIELIAKQMPVESLPIVDEKQEKREKNKLKLKTID